MIISTQELQASDLRHLHCINPRLELYKAEERFRRSGAVGSFVFCCVDSIATRRLIWEAIGNQVDFYVDGRMAAEVLRVIVACDPDSRSHYPDTLFAASESHAGACTAKSTIYCANICAGIMVSALSKYLRGFSIDPDLHINLLANEWCLAAQ